MIQHWTERLVALGACQEAIEWARAYPTPSAAWEACERSDWLLWIASRAGADRRLVVRAACACARTSLRYVAPGEHRPLRAIETAEAWTRDEAAIDDVRRAADAGNAAAYAAAYAAAKDASYTSYTSAAAYAAASAGYAAAYDAAASAAYATSAAYAAAKDASYTSYDAAAAAYASARASAGYDSATPVALREQAALVRAIVPCPVEVQP